LSKTNPSDIVFSPGEIARIGNQSVKRRMESEFKGLPLFLPGLDLPRDYVWPDDEKELPKFFLKMRAGELTSVISRPGHGKTSWMMRWAREAAALFAELDRDKDERRCVVFVTYEQHVEDLHSFHAAAHSGVSITKMAEGAITQDDYAKVVRASSERTTLPLWFLGFSEERRKARPVMTVSTLTDAILSIEDSTKGGVRWKPAAVCVDYLQRMPFDGRVESKTIGTSAVLDQLKEMFLATNTVGMTGVQAKREVDSKPVEIPAMDDGQWSSNVEQTSDRIITLTKPSKYRRPGEEFYGVRVEGDNQLLVTVPKQKMGAGSWHRWVHFDPAFNRFEVIKDHSVDLANHKPSGPAYTNGNPQRVEAASAQWPELDFEN